MADAKDPSSHRKSTRPPSARSKQEMRQKPLARRRKTTTLPAIRTATGIELDAPTPTRPPELSWIAELRLHWLGVTPLRRRRAMEKLLSAASRKTVEQCLNDIQKSLGLLYVNDVHAARVIIALFQLMGGPEPADAAKRIAAEIQKMFESFGTPPRRKRST